MKEPKINEIEDVEDVSADDVEEYIISLLKENAEPKKMGRPKLPDNISKLDTELKTKKGVAGVDPIKKETKFNTPVLNVRGMREHLGMGQNLFANYIGVFQPQLSRWEKQCYLPLDVAWRVEDMFEIDLKMWRIPDHVSEEIIKLRKPITEE